MAGTRRRRLTLGLGPSNGSDPRSFSVGPAFTKRVGSINIGAGLWYAFRSVLTRGSAFRLSPTAASGVTSAPSAPTSGHWISPAACSASGSTFAGSVCCFYACGGERCVGCVVEGSAFNASEGASVVAEGGNKS